MNAANGNNGEKDRLIFLDRFAPVHNTLIPDERQELYLRLIESFVGWAESDRWTSTDASEQGGGYYKASGRGVTWARGNSNMCLILAVLLCGRPAQAEFTELAIPRSQLLEHLEKTLRSLCLANNNGSSPTTSGALCLSTRTGAPEADPP